MRLAFVDILEQKLQLREYMENESEIRAALSALSKEELIELIINQGKRLSDLESRLLAVEQKRISAPFSGKQQPKSSHKPLGSPKGHKGYFKAIPQKIDQVLESKLVGCPCCGGELQAVTTHEQFIEDLPQIRPQVTKILTQSGYCSQCKRRVRSHHPNQISQAFGSANISLGLRAKELCLQLQYGLGMSRRKIVRVFKDYFGMNISVAGVLCQSHQASKKLDKPYQELLTSVANSGHIHVDETSWYVGSNDWWLWVFTNTSQTLYQLRDTRARSVLYDVLGKDYQGVLISDCLSVYDNVNPLQQKCYAHHLKAIKKAKEEHSNNGQGFLQQIEHCLKTAIILAKIKADLPAETFQKAFDSLQTNTLNLLKNTKNNQLEEAIANRLRKQEDHLFTFLQIEAISPTNNLAEQQLRPAVITRKIACGNRSVKGANSWQVISSLIITAKQRGVSFFDLLTNAFFYSNMSTN